MLAGVLSGGAHASEPFAWPDGARAAISLAYDDALDSQLDIALPALDRHGFKASFYLVLANPSVPARMQDWRAAAARGHELGNHTLFHQCSGSAPEREWVEPARNLDTTTRAQMADQVRVANTMLTAIDGARERTLTPPCGETRASDGDWLAPVRKDFVAVRVGGDAINDPVALAASGEATVIAPVGMTGAQLIALAREAARRGGLLCLTFHGIGGDYLTTSREAHDELLDYLAKHRQDYWVDRFVDIARYARKQHPSSTAETP